MSVVREFQSIPWNARGRRVGRALQNVLLLLAITSPAWIEGVVFKAVGR